MPLPGSRLVTAEVLTDDSWHVGRPVNDNEIIERALAVSEITGREVTLAAADYSMPYQASAAGLKTALVSRSESDTELERPSGLPAAFGSFFQVRPLGAERSIGFVAGVDPGGIR